MLYADRAFRESLWFFVAALGSTAILHSSIIILGLAFSLSPSSPSFHLYLAGLAMPSLAAIALSGRGNRLDFLRSALSVEAPLRVYAAAIFAQLGLVTVAWLLLRASGTPSEPSPSIPPGFAMLAIGQIWVVFGEELGWRGFALPRLESLLSSRQATLVLALVWGVWHAPMFFVPASLQAQASPWLFVTSIFAWSAIHTALYHRAKPSVIPNLVFHAFANITLNFGLLPPELEPYLLATYLVVGIAVWSTLRQPLAYT